MHGAGRKKRRESGCSKREKERKERGRGAGSWWPYPGISSSMRKKQRGKCLRKGEKGKMRRGRHSATFCVLAATKEEKENSRKRWEGRKGGSSLIPP